MNGISNKNFEAQKKLFIESLHLNKRLCVKNFGSGMRNLLNYGDYIEVILPQKELLEPGRIILDSQGDFFFGGRILSSSNSAGWHIKSDCGYGSLAYIDNDDIVGVVDSIQIDDMMYPIWKDQKSIEFNKEIASISKLIEPHSCVSLFLSGKILSLIKRIIFKYIIRKKQKAFKNHLLNKISPVQKIEDGR